MTKKVSDDVIDQVKACVVDKKNPTACIDKVLEEHGLEDQKSQVLTKALKTEVE